MRNNEDKKDSDPKKEESKKKEKDKKESKSTKWSHISLDLIKDKKSDDVKGVIELDFKYTDGSIRKRKYASPASIRKESLFKKQDKGYIDANNSSNINSFQLEQNNKLNLSHNPSSLEPNNKPNLSQNPSSVVLNAPTACKIITNQKVQKKHLKLLEFSLYQLWCYYYCFWRVKKKDKNESIIRNQVLMHAERDLNMKIDVLKFFKRMDQIELLTKMFLNKSQELMLNKKRKKTIYNEFPLIDSNYEEIFEFLEKSKLHDLNEYLKEKKNTFTLSDIDLSLYDTLEENIKEKLEVKLDILNNEDGIENDLENLADKIKKIKNLDK